VNFMKYGLIMFLTKLGKSRLYNVSSIGALECLSQFHTLTV
jgi:hypothetical protein